MVHDRFVEPIQQANQKWEAERLQRNPLAAPAAAWQNDPAKLLDGSQLAAAAAYAEANPQDVTEEEQEFLRESQRRETERVKEARQTRRRWLYLGLAGLVVIVVLAGLALWAFGQQAEATKQAATAQAARSEADTQKAAAQAAATQVAQQNEKAQAELNFYQATDPTDRLAELSKLLTRPDLDSQAKARQLFFSLPEVDQFSLLRVAETQLITVSRALLPNLADVNRTGYTDEHLQALLETLPGLPDAGALSDRLKAWLTARQTARDKEYQAARRQYDDLIKTSGDDPALYYERAGVLTVAGETQAALADLEQVLTLTQNPAYAVTGSLPIGPEFANGEQMIKTVRRLITVNPELARVFKNTPTDYPRLAQVGLAPEPTVITDTKGIKMVLVPAGPFKMGSNSGSSDEQPVHQVNLPEFYIDQYEVTNAQYAAFLGEKGNQEEGGVTWLSPGDSRLSGEGKAWQIAAGYDDHPVTGVSWYGAKAYCAWRGGRLPTEAEWEKAARGDDQRTYPWGEQINCDLANYTYDCRGETTSVGDYPAGVSPYGAYDMVGNVWEWVADWYDENYYKNSPSENPTGPKDKENKSSKVLRDGCWYYGQGSARATTRCNSVPDIQTGNIGFRCVSAAAP